MLKLETLKEKLHTWIGFDCCNTLHDMQSELFQGYLFKETGYRAMPALLSQAIDELIDEGKIVRSAVQVCQDDNGNLIDVAEYELSEHCPSRNDHLTPELIAILDSADCAIEEADYLHAANLLQAVVNEFEGEEMTEDTYAEKRIDYLLDRATGSGDVQGDLEGLLELKRLFDKQFNAALAALTDM